MTNKFMRKREKIRAQMKSRFYYWFWGAATVTVVSGQFYVGSGYRQMARSLDRWFDETIDIMQEPVRRQRQDMEYDIITNLTCPKCESYVEVYHKIENKL